ncbi:MAG: SDR family oxidoreductase [Planctomycetia bacterium]
MTDLPDSGKRPPSIRLIIGYGYLGRALAQLWRGPKVRVLATTRRRERFAELEADGVEPILWDVTGGSSGDGDAKLPQVDCVVYCVGYDRSTGVPVRAVYVDGLARTLDRLPTPAKLIYTSSTGVYGDAAGGMVDEFTSPAPIDPSGEACLEAEGVVRRYAEERGCAALVLRLAGLYGPGRMIGAEALKRGEPIAADPDAYLNLIHVADAAYAVDAARLSAEPGSLYLVSDGAPVRRREFYGHIASLLKTPLPTFDVSAARRHRGDRRIDNRRMLQELGVALAFPDYRRGLEDAL